MRNERVDEGDDGRALFRFAGQLNVVGAVAQLDERVLNGAVFDDDDDK